MAEIGRVEDGGRGEPSRQDTGRFTGVDDLAVQLSELARELQAERSVQDLLDEIVAAAVANVPGAQQAGISQVRDHRRIDTTAATSEVVQRVDEAQYETGEGPCLSSIYDERTVRLPDVGSEPRWPRFAARAAELGVGSMLSFQLYVRGEELGALNLYSDRVDAFDDESEHVGLLLASHAAVAMAGAQQQENLRAAIATRDLIGQAKGILMERYKVSEDQAFSILVRASQNANRKLRDVAEQLSSSGELVGRGSG
ncbi:GAF and ANTAR domain-containing protein [Pseudonocardia sichuanensis]